LRLHAVSHLNKSEMIVEQTNDEVVFRISNKITLDELQDVSDMLQFTELGKKSDASQSDVDDLVKSIKKGRWARTKAKLS